MLLLILSKINFLKKVKYFFWDYFQRWIKYAFSALVSIYSRPVYERTQCNNHPFLIENFNVNILFQKLFQPIGKKDSAHRCKMSGISSQTKHLVWLIFQALEIKLSAISALVSKSHTCEIESFVYISWRTMFWIAEYNAQKIISAFFLKLTKVTRWTQQPTVPYNKRVQPPYASSISNQIFQLLSRMLLSIHCQSLS